MCLPGILIKFSVRQNYDKLVVHEKFSVWGGIARHDDKEIKAAISYVAPYT